MSFENFITQYGYTPKANDFASSYSVKSNDNNLAGNKNNVSTLQTSQTSLNGTRANQEDFADFLNSVKEDHNTKQDKLAEEKAARTDKDQQTQDAPKATKEGEALNQAKDAASAFYSKEAAMSIALTQEESATSGAKTLDEFNSGLQLLSNELQTLIDSQSEQDEITKLSAQIEEIREEGFTISEEGHIQTQEGELPEEGSLLQLLSSLIAKIDAQEDGAETSEASTDVIQKITELIGQDSGTDLTTILSGLKPEEITDLKEQINSYLTGELETEEQEALASLITQYYPLSQPKRTDEKPSEAIQSRADAVSDNILKADIKAAKNTDDNTAEHKKNDRYDTRFSDGKYEKTAGQSQDKPSESGDFNAKLRDLSTQKGQSVTPSSDSKADTALSASQRFLQTNASNMLPSGLTEEGISTQNNANSLAAIQSQNTVTSSLANVTTQAHSATQNHPATQMVSMTMQKAIKEGDESNIKIRLDPPDLGRVEVKMSIDKDNITKIVLTAEKPETHLLLKQDAEALQRVMNDAGLNADGGLSFELASEDHEFNQNNGSNSNDHSNGSRGSDSEDDTAIQTTMDWHVDPKTGRMHYNILA